MLNDRRNWKRRSTARIVGEYDYGSSQGVMSKTVSLWSNPKQQRANLDQNGEARPCASIDFSMYI